ncbi:MAG TPA: sulfatase [Vicinamibacteria bacterium]|nr:sulfatase [Vicinamibacteria bacterium]
MLVSLDTLHVDWTSPYNSKVSTTPFLSRFASEGTRFARAYTLVPITLPSHASLMTGLSPERLGVFANGDEVPEFATTLAEHLSRDGYRTAAFVSLGVLRPAFRLDQGFEHYPDPFESGPARWYRTADEVLDLATSWIEEHANEPFFLWVHFSDPHAPYLPKGAPPDAELYLDGELVRRVSLVGGETYRHSLSLPPGRHRLRFVSLREPTPDDRPETAIELRFRETDSLARWAARLPREGSIPLDPEYELELSNPERETVDVELLFWGNLARPTPTDVLPGYEAEVEYIDRSLARLDALLDSLGTPENTLSILVSDHGEGLFRHDFLGHTTEVYEDQLRILWMMRGPGIPVGRVIDESAARITDVAPTVLDLIGVGSAEMDGRSWAECLGGGPCPGEEPFWAFGLDHDRKTVTSMAGYDWPYKWIWHRGLSRSGFDLERDPWEETDLLLEPDPGNPEPLKRLAEGSPGVRRRLRQAIRGASSRTRAREQEEMLRSLGYLEPEARAKSQNE